MKKLDIIYEDKELLVVNKPSKMLTISDGKSSNTLYNMAYSYVKKQYKGNKIFIVHRLDRDTSGIVVFAKSEKVKRYLQDNWNKIAKREYIAILEGNINCREGVIKNYLWEDKTHKVHVVKKHGEYSETHYQVIKYTKNCSLVKVYIKTGKKNQIRVSFSHMGYPIIGDKKYGSSINPIKRLGLHAVSLSFKFNDREYQFEAKMPKEFLIFT